MNTRKVLVGCILSSLAAFAPQASADQVFTLGTTVNGKPYSATASFSVGNGIIDLTVTNNVLLAQVLSTAQWVSQVGFSIFNYATAISDTLASVQGPVESVTYVNGAAPVFNPGGTTPWTYGLNPVSGYPSTGGGFYQISALLGSDKTLVAPLTTVGNSAGYCTTSPANNPKCPDGIGGSFNPEYNGSVTFRMVFAGLAAGTQISNVSIGFGTAPGGSNPEEPDVAVPIPAAAWLFGSGLLGLVAIARRNRFGAGTKAAA
jgi:hypothetical protein